VPADRVQVIEGDVLDEDLLTRTVTGQDIVYANLGGATSKLRPAPSSQR
jgi:putative NADH-flavin reductase